MLGLIVRAQTNLWQARRLLRRQEGQTTSEYIVIAGIVVAIIIGIMVAFKGQISSALSTLGGQVKSGAGGT